MRQIPLTGKGAGLFAIVDDCDYESLSMFSWHLCKDGYAMRRTRVPRPHTVWMHCQILDTELDVDHKNTNKLDNRRDNLRPATKGQNQANKGVRKDSTTGLKGVKRCREKWQARIRVDGAERHLGTFATPSEAAAAYDAAAIEYFGEFARTNSEIQAARAGSPV